MKNDDARRRKRKSSLAIPILGKTGNPTLTRLKPHFRRKCWIDMHLHQNADQRDGDSSPACPNFWRFLPSEFDSACPLQSVPSGDFRSKVFE